MKDFSRARPAITFRVDDDVFTGVPAMPADDMINLVGSFQTMDENSPAEVQKTMKEIFRKLLDSRSAELLIDRMGDSSRPIEFDQANDIVLWLMGEYGMRPTEQPSPSGSGQASPESGTNLTEPTSVAVSISSPSPGTGS